MKSIKTEDEETESSADDTTANPQVLGTGTQKTSLTAGKSIDSEENDRDYGATFSGEVLNASDSGEEKEEEKPEEVTEEKSRDWLVPVGLSGGGLVLLGTAAFPFLKPRLGKLLAHFPKKTRSS